MYISKTTLPVLACFLCVACVGLSIGLFIPLLAILMDYNGASNTLIGIQGSIGGLACILIIPHVSRIASYTGVPQLMIAALGIASLAMLGFMLTTNFYLWAILRFVFTGMFGILFVLSEYWISVIAPISRRGFIMGLYATVLAFAYAIGPRLLSIFGAQSREIFYIGLAIFITGALPLFFVRRQSPKIHKDSRIHLFKHVRRSPIPYLAAFVCGIADTGIMSGLPIYGLDLGYSEQTSAHLLEALFLGHIFFQLPFGYLVDHIDKNRFLCTIGVFCLLGTFCMPFFSHSIYFFYGFLFVWGGVASTLYTVGLSFLSKTTEDHNLIEVNMSFLLCFEAGMLFGPSFVGVMMDLISPQGFAYSMTTVFSIFIIVVSALLLFTKRTDPVIHNRQT